MGGKGKLLIDGDIVAYRAAFATQDLFPEDATAKVDDLIFHIMDNCLDLPFPSEEDFQVYLTGPSNFRHDVAKSYPYKGNRKSADKPIHLGLTREYLVDKCGAITSSNEEADDLIAKEAASLNYNCVVASVDKDMLQIPCWHFNFSKNEMKKVDEFEGLKFFYTQILTGDRADNIVGLYKVGPVTASNILKGCKTEGDLWEAVVNAYGEDVERVVENARLLWLRRYDNQMWEPPSKEG